MNEKIDAILCHIYNTLNKKVFYDEPLPEIPLRLVFDEYYLACVHATNNIPKEICVCFDYVEDLEQLVGAILHEMIHVYCAIHNIPHFDIETKTHLPGFIQEAERRGLIYDDFFIFNCSCFDMDELFNKTTLM